MQHSPTTMKDKQYQTISSRNHIAIKRIRVLQDREERDRKGLFYGEGVRFLVEAVKHQARIETVVVARSLCKHGNVLLIIEKLRRSGVPILEVSAEVMHSIASIDDPQGVGVVVRQKWRTLEQVKLDGKLCWIALDSIQSPGNFGSMIRTASAVGAAGFILLDENADPYDPATVRASMGALFTQRFVRTTPEQLTQWKLPRQWKVIGTSPTAQLSYRQADFKTTPTIVLFGSERKGLRTELLAICDAVVSIPMSTKIDSLNIAVAAGVVLYEVWEQRARDA